MAEHKHGEMDITVQTETFNGFIKFTTYSVVVICFIALFLAIFGA
ncbi:aa3-type cytochrome c oxidase subunit IV [Ruegeria arenilitoris]|nr:aa3-type cytochrome c oxidase subunit IV [Ruegeria arenilitoris]